MTLRPGAALTTAMVALTATTGMIEAVSYLVLGPVFTAVQTGNLLLLGFAIAGEGGLSPAASAASLGGFAAGAVLGARFQSSVDLRGHRWFTVALLAEALLLGGAGILARGMERAGGHPAGAHYAVIVTVAAAMGMRNVTTLRARVPDLTTTVATRALTSLLAPLALDTRIPSDTRTQIRRGAAVGAMFAGGLLGAWMLREALSPAVVLLTVAGCVLVTAVGHGVARGRTDKRMHGRETRD
ncbi:YoaK family protein [Streptomyces sp. NPDC004609]|uniref:YoaK family protein n=1 Tax=Streptomyces sp. NPDC004609 TaxID=3364704 RepID=UPI0036C6F1DC